MPRYNAPEEVPKVLKSIGGYPLSVEQSNQIADSIDMNGPFCMCIHHAKQQFIDSHDIANDMWVTK